MGEVGYAAAFLGGVVSILSPCSAMLLPGFLAYAFTSRTTLLGRTGLLYLGMLTTLVPLGVAASSLGSFFSTNRSLVFLVVGLIVIALGLVQAAGINLQVPMPWRTRGRDQGDSSSPLAVYLLGGAYGLAGGCTGPILGSILAIAASGPLATGEADPVYGGVLLAVYAAGMVLPVLVLALLWDVLDVSGRAFLRPRPVQLGPVTTTVGNLVSGLLFVGVGLLLVLTDGTLGLGGVLSSEQQLRLEGWVRSAGGVLDLVVLGVIVLALGAATALALWRRGARD